MNRQHLVIGSAGHVDHGKSSIVKQLTNIDPTRLKEEIEKNITIDLGFSYFFLDDKSVGIVDLPGHEKFVSNMIVGSSNIDMILFVIAADDGIMPQTIEHFDILSLLQIKHAIIVLNKVDLVSEQLLAQRYEEIKEFFEKTPFENAPIVQTSIYQEETIDNLREILIDYIKNNTFTHRHFDIFRMAVDRSFTIKGQGTIVTGTSQGKELFLNDNLEIYPSNKIVKVRNIQNHNRDVESITSGHRTALQLGNVTKTEVKRGDILATPNSLKSSRFLDVLVSVLKSSKPIKNNQLIRIYHQTREYIGRIKLSQPNIKPGSQGFATIILNEDIYALKNDLAIIRFYSPIKTIGGLEIINLLDEKPNITKDYYDRYLDNNTSQQIINFLKQNKHANLHQIKSISPNHDEISEALKLLLANKTVIEFTYNNKPQYILEEYLNELRDTLISEVSAFHQENPLFLGIPLLKLYESLKDEISYKVFKALMPLFYELKVNNDIVGLKDFKIVYNNDQKNKKNGIMTYIKNNGYSLLKFDDVYQKYPDEEDKIIIQSMINQKQLFIIDSEYLILDRMYQRLIDTLKKLEEENDKILLSDFKQELDISRKYCILLLEHFDNNQITKRIDDYRILIK